MPRAASPARSPSTPPSRSPRIRPRVRARLAARPAPSAAARTDDPQAQRLERRSGRAAAARSQLRPSPARRSSARCGDAAPSQLAARSRRTCSLLQDLGPGRAGMLPVDGSHHGDRLVQAQPLHPASGGALSGRIARRPCTRSAPSRRRGAGPPVASRRVEVSSVPGIRAGGAEGRWSPSSDDLHRDLACRSPGAAVHGEVRAR